MASLKKISDKPVEPPDSHFLSAAQGWLELGSIAEAVKEMASISQSLQRHPDVLEIKWNISAAQRRWEEACESASELLRIAPHRCSGWIQRSYALHELKRTGKAYELLLPAAGHFAKIHTIPYNLACYCCQLNRLDEARQWLGSAIGIAGLKAIQTMAESDPDLAPLRKEIWNWKSS